MISYSETLNHDKFKDRIKKIEFYSNILTIITLVVLLIGMYKYYLEKKKQYRSKFSYITFLVGTTKLCINK